MKEVLAASLCIVCISSLVHADTFVSGENQFTIDFVTIGNPGNPGDTRAEANPYGCGAVDYTYRLGKYEVTNSQWNAFVAEAGAPTGNPSTGYDEESYLVAGDQLPTSFVSWYEAAQFCNYLTSGDKSQGAYQFSNGDFTGIDRESAMLAYGIVYVIPSEDEWYKAAYYTGMGYSTYANGTNVAPIAGVDTNYDYAMGNEPWYVGRGTQEQNGTFDMMGNAQEWNETILDSGPGFRGGSFCHYDISFLSSSARSFINVPYYENYNMGFRVAAIPEPCSMVLFSLGGFVLFIRRRLQRCVS